MGRRAVPASAAGLLRTGFLSSLFLYVLFKLYHICFLIGFLKEAFFVHNDENLFCKYISGAVTALKASSHRQHDTVSGKKRQISCL